MKKFLSRQYWIYENTVRLYPVQTCLLKLSNILHKVMNKSCEHDYKPINFICTDNDEYGREHYLYEVQCMLCGRKSVLLRGYTDKQPLCPAYKMSESHSDGYTTEDK